MKLRDLQYFCSLYKTGTFTELAKSFKVEQPTVTLAIKRLENELGETLVLRNRSKGIIEVTQVGEILYHHAQNILHEENLASTEIKHFNKGIRFGLPPIIGNLYFPLVAKKIAEDGLMANLELDETGSNQLYQDLMAGKIDIALLGSSLPIRNKKLTTNFLSSGEFVIISSKKHWLAKQNTVSFEDLKQEPFVTLNGKFIHDHVLNLYSQRVNFSPKIIFETQSIETLKNLVAQDVGIALLVKDAILPTDNLAVNYLQSPLPEKFNVSIATRKDYIRDNLEKKFIEDLEVLKNKIHQA